MDPTPPKTLLDQVRDSLRVKHYAYRTEESYVQWIQRYILFHNKRHPKDMAESEVQAFLTHLAVEGNVAASTQNQALSALLFLYRHGSKSSQPNNAPLTLEVTKLDGITKTMGAFSDRSNKQSAVPKLTRT
jgi:site-specific recombinase XerD